MGKVLIVGRMDIDFNKLIENFLKGELKKKTAGVYYPSEIGSCLRKTFYSYNYPRETNTELMKFFQTGIFIHDFIVDVIKSEKNSDVELLVSESPFKFGVDDFTISGRIDDIVLLKISGVVYLLEIKSTGNLNYVNEPSLGHIYQTQVYMHHTGIRNGIILYIEKNSLKTRWFNVDYDNGIADLVINRFRELHSYLTRNELPKAEAKTTKELNWQCRNCDYCEECDNDKL